MCSSIRLQGRDEVVERWPEIVGTVGGGFCHKPSTVSGGGKSEISETFNDAIVCGLVFIADWNANMKLAREVIEKIINEVS